MTSCDAIACSDSPPEVMGRSQSTEAVPTHTLTTQSSPHVCVYVCVCVCVCVFRVLHVPRSDFMLSSVIR